MRNGCGGRVDNLARVLIAAFRRLYNHIRTVAFWLDAAPLLTDLGLPFKVCLITAHAVGIRRSLQSLAQVGIDDIVSLVPIYGDVIAGILQLYQVFLSFLFGIDYSILGWMVSCRVRSVAWIVPDFVFVWIVVDCCDRHRRRFRACTRRLPRLPLQSKSP